MEDKTVAVPPKEFLKVGIAYTPKFSPSVIRFEYLDRFFGVLFNCLVNRCKFVNIFATRYAGIVLHGLLQYLMTPRFSELGKLTPEVTQYLAKKMQNIEQFIRASIAIGEAGFEERDIQIMKNYPALFTIECLLGRDFDDILEHIEIKDDSSRQIASTITEKMVKIDCWLQKTHKALSDLGSNPYTGSIFASLLIRILLQQFVSAKNNDCMDKNIFAFLYKRKIDFTQFSTSFTQVSRAVLNEDDFKVLEGHSSIFLATFLLGEGSGYTLYQLLTSSDDFISNLPNSYFSSVMSNYENSFTCQ